MNRKEKEKFKKLLIKEKIRIYETIGYLQKDSLNNHEMDIDHTGIPTHLAEMGTDNFEKDLELDLASAEGKIVESINEALAKIENNTYGLCEDCKKQIDRKRLTTISYAKLCIDCQKKNEV